MKQKPTLERIIAVAAQALLAITVLILVNHRLGVPPAINRTISLLLTTGVATALVESIKKL